MFSNVSNLKQLQSSAAPIYDSFFFIQFPNAVSFAYFIAVLPKNLIFPEGRSFFLEKPRLLQVQHLSLMSLIGGNIENIKGQFSVLIFISYNDISSRFKCTARL